MSRALNVLALAFALAFAGCSSTSERTRAEGFRSPRIFAGGFGAAQGGGGGNPTGYSESSGTVTIADELNVGTAADAVATGDFAAGLTGDRRMVYDQSAGSLSLLSASGTFTHSLTAGGNELTVNGASSIGFQSAGTYRMSLSATGLLCSTAGALPIGTTSNPFGSLTLGDATAQVALGHDGATDGLVTISDPNGVASGRLDLLSAGGTHTHSLTASGDTLQITGNGFLNATGGGNNIRWGGGYTYVYTALTPGSASGSNLGSTSLEWANLYVGTGRAYFGASQEGSVFATGGNALAVDGAAGGVYVTNSGNARWHFQAGGALLPFVANSYNIGGTSSEIANLYLGTGRIYLGTGQEASVHTGTGDPEGAVTANVGSLYLRSDGSTGTTLYVKESGTGNTGWAAK